MSGPFGDKPIPKPILIGAALLLSMTIALVAVARLTGYKLGEPPPSTALASRVMIFVDQADGSVMVIDPDSRATIDTLPPGAYGFVRGAMRAMAREHRGLPAGAEARFRLTSWNDGRLSLEDMTTGGTIEITAYGHTNTESFARLLTIGKPDS